MVALNNVLDVFKLWEPASKTKGLPFGSYLHSGPPRRQRTLTAPIEPYQDSFWHRIQVFSSVEAEQHTDLQTQCAFLSVLPVDIRMIIYEMVLGGMAFHITTNEPDRSRLLCHICKRPGYLDDDKHQECYASTKQRRSSAPREDYPHATGLLPLLVSCRRIYSEAIDTLYSANTFDFWENRVAFRFLKIMLPSQRLRSIRNFRWDMRIPHHPNINSRSQKDWGDLFLFFTNETCGLQHLYLKLMTNHPIEAEIRETPDDEACGWIRPMILMSVDAKRKRGCKTEVVTNGLVHEPAAIFGAIERAYPFESYNELLRKTSAEMHRRIRLSLDHPG